MRNAQRDLWGLAWYREIRGDDDVGKHGLARVESEALEVGNERTCWFSCLVHTYDKRTSTVLQS